jgi:hypothetical protein
MHSAHDDCDNDNMQAGAAASSGRSRHADKASTVALARGLDESGHQVRLAATLALSQFWLCIGGLLGLRTNKPRFTWGVVCNAACVHVCMCACVQVHDLTDVEFHRDRALAETTFDDRGFWKL